MENVIDPANGTPEEKQLESIKYTIKVVEGLFAAVNSGFFNPRWNNAVQDGLNFLNQTHQTLLKNLPPDEIEKVKAEETAKIAAKNKIELVN